MQFWSCLEHHQLPWKGMEDTLRFIMIRIASLLDDFKSLVVIAKLQDISLSIARTLIGNVLLRGNFGHCLLISQELNTQDYCNSHILTNSEATGLYKLISAELQFLYFIPYLLFKYLFNSISLLSLHTYITNTDKVLIFFFQIIIK